jgi:ABC-type transport system involved in multi-copper enzyme maturation permease subunit
MTATTLTGWQATTALARLSLRRVLRGKALWFAIAIGLFPCLLAIAWRANSLAGVEAWDRVTVTFALVMAIVAPILVASSLSDEIDDRTAAYLWSRAVPRWTVVSGKLLGLAPVVAGSLVLGLLACWLILGGPTVVSGAEFARALVGFVAGAIGCSAVSALIATLAPRFAVPIAVAWLLLLDATVGALDVGLHAITVSFGTKAIARGDDGLVGPLSLVVITVLALAIACYRVDKIE